MMSNFELTKALQRIAVSITHGEPASIELTCPKCGYSPLVFSYAVNRLPKYGLYIHCKNCKLLHHFILASKPPNFQENLILPEYQILEDQAMQF